jgi:hypothetical protein
MEALDGVSALKKARDRTRLSAAAPRADPQINIYRAINKSERFANARRGIPRRGSSGAFPISIIRNCTRSLLRPVIGPVI